MTSVAVRMRQDIRAAPQEMCVGSTYSVCESEE